MQKHSYLFESADWLAQGNYYDEEGRRSGLTGLSHIRRSDGVWTLWGFMEVAGKRFTNDYELRADGELSLSWAFCAVRSPSWTGPSSRATPPKTASSAGLKR